MITQDAATVPESPVLLDKNDGEQVGPLNVGHHPISTASCATRIRNTQEQLGTEG